MAQLETKVAAMLARALPDYQALRKVERLSGGASQETYRIEVNTTSGEKVMAMRRAPGGATVDPTPGHPGLDVEGFVNAECSSRWCA